MSQNEQLEVEVKFLLDDVAEMRERLLAIGAVIARPRVYERNVRFDTEDQALLKKQELLRLRSDDNQAVLTFKSPSKLDRQSEAKVRQEIETRVDNSDNMAIILERLGFQPLQVYEKFREAYHLNGLEIVLDEMPYGEFIELEGSEQAIKRTAGQLGLVWEDRILTSYLAIMAVLIARYNLPFQDITFDNFVGRDDLVRDALPLPNLD
jgi:adenylate cyclase, class 2